MEGHIHHLDHQHQSLSPFEQAVARASRFHSSHTPDDQKDDLSSSFSKLLPLDAGIGGDEPEVGSEESMVSSDLVDYSLIKLWLKSCEQHHGAECNRRELEPDTLGEVNIILIDTRRRCLVKATTATRYLALSYVWGAVSQFQNTSAICESLMTPDALIAHKGTIPQVIIDAIEVVDSLEENYLWVDSLCIVQDDAEAKHDQICHMASIYSSAVLTLAAVSARDASSNLPGVRPGTRWPRSWRQNGAELCRPLRPDIVLKTIDRSRYTSRAWIFQERHLSRRCLYFLDEQVYFQCRTELWCEEPSPISFPRSGRPLDLGLSIMSRAPEWAENIKLGDWDHGFAYYAEVIQEYSWKVLSYPEDVINAFSRIVTALETHSGWNITHGLPEQLIDWALLWSPADVQQRRPPPQSGPLLQFPSWSWIGWIGPVTFNLAYVFALVTIRSLLEDVEVEDFGDDTAKFRISQRIVVEKYRVPGHFDHEGKLAITYASNTVKPPTLWKPHYFVPGSTLRFSAMTISTAAFEVKEMPPWQWHSEINADKRAKGDQNGIFIISGTRLAGLLLGISMKFIRKYQWSKLRLVAISETNGRDEHSSSNPFQYHRGSEDKLWQLYENWDREHFRMVYNVLLIQRRGPYYERVAVGQVDKQSWGLADPVKEKILLV